MPIRTPDQRVRVFVSSTLAELADERRAARAAIEQLRLTPIMFELGARPHPPRTLYRSYLEQSDVFVGIYWQRYGWVAPDMEISGLEDELVLSAGMPRLIYVKRPATEMEPRLATMLRALEGDGGPSYKPFADAGELEQLVLDDLALLLAERFDASGSTPAPERPPSNVPAPTSTFVGRRDELANIRALLDDPAIRLVTLAGPGGTGKTRLAVEAAREDADLFADGVFFVDLSAEREPEEAFGAIARILDVSGASGDSPLVRIEQTIHGRHVLLVLDNVEQVTSIGPGLIELLERCRRLTIVVTSRATLRVNGEHVVPVPVMSLPDDETAPSVDDVLASESGRLFVERARSLGSAFTLTDENAADVAAICRRLDGLPLAIELAAARVTVFTVAELRQRLDQRLDLLTGGGRDRPSRQRTLHDAISWSHDLLTDDERTVFRCSSVFCDGLLGDIEAVLGGVPGLEHVDVVETLSSLVDKHLVRVVPACDRRLRFSMLQTIQEFATARSMEHPDERRAVQRAHASHYLAIAVGLQRQLSRTDRAVVLGQLGDELGNLRISWGHWIEHRDAERLDDLLAPLWGYYEATGDYRSTVVLGEELLGVLADLPDVQRRLSDELTLRANLARTQLVVRGFSTEAEHAMVEALERYESTGDAGQRFPALRGLAALQLWRSDFTAGAMTAAELMSVARESGDPALLADAHLMRCISTSWPRDLTEAIADADAAATSFAATTSGFVEFRVGPSPGVVSAAVAGLLRWTAGYPDAATRSMQRSLDLAIELDHPYSYAFALHHATLLAFWRSDTAAVETYADESRRLADLHDYEVWRALASVFGGVARAGGDDPAAGLLEMEDGFAQYEELPTPPIFSPTLLAVRAVGHGAAGDVERGLALVAEAGSSIRDGHPARAEIAIAHGDLLVASSAHDVERARAMFRLAVDLSAPRGARMLELQALTRLVALNGSGPVGSGTRGRLNALYDTFDEGFDSAPLVAAAAELRRTDI